MYGMRLQETCHAHPQEVHMPCTRTPTLESRGIGTARHSPLLLTTSLLTLAGVTRRYKVEGHTAGTPVFDYQHNPSVGFCSTYYNDVSTNRYFLDGCLAAFDAAGEWAVDSNGHLLLRLPDEYNNADISSLEVRGKVQTYAMAFVS